MIIRLVLCFFTAVALTMRFALPEELGELAAQQDAEYIL